MQHFFFLVPGPGNDVARILAEQPKGIAWRLFFAHGFRYIVSHSCWDAVMLAVCLLNILMDQGAKRAWTGSVT